MPVVEEENTAPRPAASTGRNLKQDEYWRSLERSFNNDFLKVARWNYMRAHQSLDEIPMAELTEDGTPILPEGWEDD